ncbi:flagellar protein FlaG [Evansella vedderi]|uniref:Flagellar protein FlaG n=1 Tax=Evansella vedderi TaxID=38282 RepID=A0ABT9ZTH2_9BACI|nr:flagellar protein FlaG [Evansella vedderi]MDQ0254536.1 flagellar protein FlaG [Evansella vedderi]
MEVKSLGNLSTAQQNFFGKDSPKPSNNEESRLEESIQNNQGQKKEASKGLVKEKVNAMNELVDLQFTSIKFQFHEQLDRYFVQVVNRHTEEIVKEIPPEEFLDMISSMLEFAGIIIDKKI